MKVAFTFHSFVHGIFQAGILGGLPFPSPGDLPDPGIEPGSPALQADSLLSEPPGDDAVVFHGLCDTVNCKMHHYFM